MNIENYKDILGDNLYVQGFAANPVFLNLTGYSGFVKEHKTKLRITHFMLKYKNEYSEAGYYKPDFERIWKKIKPQVMGDLDYLKGFKKEYLKDWQKYLDLYRKIDQIDLSKISDKELVEFLNKCSWGQVYSGGVSHVFIEPIGIEIEKEIKADLLNALNNKSKFNQYFSQLTAPTKYSWVTKEELDLKKISKLTKDKAEPALKSHLNKYYFVQNNYTGSKNITLSGLKERLKDIANEKVKVENPLKVKKKKEELIKKLNLNLDIRKKIKIIDYISIWQDERKANIFIAIHYLDKIIREIAKRVGVDRKALYYLSPEEALRIKGLFKIKRLKNELLARKKGCYYYLYGIDKEKIFKGEEYKELVKLKEEIDESNKLKNESLHGSIANIGTAVGRVVICKNIAHIKKVQEGDILVSSMTRPEFMPAIKKAGAIVTDEGGITCHAAIVARELGKPCIIGTKIATTVLKEGVVVEVKANHGVVNILKNKK